MNANIPDTKLKRVIIIGGGFAGLEMAKHLSCDKFQIVLIDKNNYHQFQPLLYQVATAGLEPSSIAFPFRKIFQKAKSFHFRMGEVLMIHPIKKTVETTIGEIEYDTLIIATGADTNYYGNQNIAKNSMAMKNIYEALTLRNSILQRIEDALVAPSEKEKKQNLNVVIAGGGPTGVEIAGTLAEMRSYILPKDYKEMDFSSMKIYLLEGAPRVLNSFSEISSKKATEYLVKMGVEVMVDTLVTDYDGSEVHLKNGKKIPTKTMIWTAGIMGNALKGLPKEAEIIGGRIAVNEFNEVINAPSVYAIGDVALMKTAEYPKGHPQMAQGAIQQGRNLGRNLNRDCRGIPRKPFQYKNLGSMATIGRNKAVVELPKYKFQGFFAWLVWMVVHLRSILGLKNKLIVFLNWVWNYITYNLSLRLIITHKKEKPS